MKAKLHFTPRTQCYHCGESCTDATIVSGDKSFCCQGCKTVYDLLNRNGLCDYYAYNETPGARKSSTRSAEKFAFMDTPELATGFIEFASSSEVQARFYLPQIHCSSCFWLLENLSVLHKGVKFCTVEFDRKEALVSFDPRILSIRELAELLADIGYEPYVSQRGADASEKNRTVQRKRLVKIGIAGFCFANIMMLSFPEYLGLDTLAQDGLSAEVFRYLNLLLSLPVFFYAGTEFFANAWLSIKQRILNIDAPIALALAVTFLRSLYEVFTHTGSGYFDSLSGIIFFMLVGRAFQNRTYNTLKFNRDYTSYFPIAVCSIADGNVGVYKKIQDVRSDEKIRIHNNEIVPVDAILINGKAQLDYSFVTGENEVHPVGIGEIVYAGGRQTQGNIDLLVLKEFSQSRFTRLWNDEVFAKTEKNTFSFVTTISKYFSIAVISLAIVVFAFWQWQDASKAWNAFTAVLIVACPCALLLANTFTEGFMLNIFSRHGFFLKNGEALQNLAKADHIVFDKTGTITIPAASQVAYFGKPFSAVEAVVVSAMFRQSLHPLSRAIQNSVVAHEGQLEHFKESQSGMEAWVNEVHYKIGSAAFVGSASSVNQGSEVWVGINGRVMGKYIVHNILRSNIGTMMESLHAKVTVLSGDNDHSKKYLQEEIHRPVYYKFQQTPEDKLRYVGGLQHKGKKVMMVGDGLNDAGALKKSNMGIAVVENAMQFSPACEGIMLAEKLPWLHRFIAAALRSNRLIVLTFVVSVFYNIVGLYFSVTAQLSPLIAAVIMPLSTISIVLVTLLGSTWIENRYFQRKESEI